MPLGVVNPSFVAVGTDGSATNAAPVANKPANVIEGQILIAYVAYQSSASINSVPSGWTQIGATNTFGSTKTSVYYKALGDELATTTYTWGLDSSVTWLTRIICYANVDTVGVLDQATSNTGSGTSMTALGITTIEGNELLLMIMANDGGAVTYTPPGGMTERVDANAVAMADVVQGSAGASGDQVATASLTGNWGARLIALRKNNRARRFYVDGAATPAISPAFGAEWDDSGSAVRRVGKDVKGASAKANVTQAETSTSANRDQLCVQVVIGPLGAGILSGAVKCQVRMSESATGYNGRSQVLVRLVDGSGAEQSVPFAGDLGTGTTNPTNEFGTTSANRRFPRIASSRHMTAQPYAAGWYLVVEIGAREHNTSATSMSATARIGESATDFAEDDTTTTDNCPWIEFTEGVTLMGEGAESAPGPYLRRAA